VSFVRLGRLNVAGEDLMIAQALSCFMDTYVGSYYNFCLHLSAKSRRPPKFTDSELERAFSLYIQRLEANMKDTIKRRLAFDPGNDGTNARLFLLALLAKEPNDLEVACLKHWIWTVKRGMSRMPIDRQLFLNFYGSQGTGKSTAIKKLIAPVDPFVWRTSVDSVVDSREGMNFERNYIVFLDELAGAQKADKEALKRLVTEDTLHVRMMRTNSHSTVIVNARPIACSNKPIRDMLNDATGMRRFFEFDVEQQANWASLNQMDMVQVWTCVDESKTRGYLDGDVLLAALAERQKAYVRRLAVDAWAEQFDWTTGLELRPKEAIVGEILRWARENGYTTSETYQYNAEWVGRWLKVRTGRDHQRMQKQGVAGGKRVWWAWVPAMSAEVPMVALIGGGAVVDRWVGVAGSGHGVAGLPAVEEPETAGVVPLRPEPW